jgi:hypothetical protein
MRDIEAFRRAHISTSQLPERNRLATWREIYGRGITNVDIEPIGNEPFHAEVTFDLLPNVSIAAGVRSPAHYRVSPELAARGGKDIVAVSILRSGAASATQFGQELIRGIGSASVLAATDASTSTMLTRGSFITLALSRPTVAALVPNYSSAFGRSIPSNSAALGLLVRYLDVIRGGDELTNPAIGRSVSEHIIDLAALALGARGDGRVDKHDAHPRKLHHACPVATDDCGPCAELFKRLRTLDTEQQRRAGSPGPIS